MLWIKTKQKNYKVKKAFFLKNLIGNSPNVALIAHHGAFTCIVSFLKELKNLLSSVSEDIHIQALLLQWL